ncbi:MAG: hypothetical protein IJ779_06045 [Ruminococcus sp.]|nr:hypothetical protein [Ruminococcus sp.]
MKPFETLHVGGSEYHLKLTTSHAVQLEEELGTDLLSGLDRLSQISVLAKYLYHAAMPLNDDICSINDVYQLIDDFITDGGSIEELQNLIVETLYTSGILSKQMYDASKKMAGKQQEALQKLLS